MKKGDRIPLRERLARFMQGRNGPDAIYRFCFYVYLVILIVHLFVRSPWFTVAECLLIGYIFFRLLSRNLYARQRENARFLDFFRRIKRFFSLKRDMWRDRRTHVYKKCPYCKNVLRLPKKKGEHTVCCPCCDKRFDLKIR